MNNGWIALRRGLLDHLVSGTLSTNEYTAFTILLLNADAETGAGSINAPMLHATFLPDLSLDTCQRVLAKLEAKQFIWRLNPNAHKRAYRYWVNKFECTRGANRMRRTDLSQVFVSNDINDIRYVDPAHDMSDDVSVRLSAQVSAHRSADHHDSYNKDTDKDTDADKDNSSSPSLKHSKDANRGSANVRRYRDADSGSGTVSQGLKPISDAEPDETKRGEFLKPLSEASSPAVAPVAIRLRFQYGEDPGWFDGSRKLGFAEVNEHLARMGMKLSGTGEIYEGGVLIPWKEAVEKIEGTTK